MSKSEDFGDGVSGAFCHWIALGDFSVGHNGLGSWDDDDTHMYGVHDRRWSFLNTGTRVSRTALGVQGFWVRRMYDARRILTIGEYHLVI